MVPRSPTTFIATEFTVIVGLPVLGCTMPGQDARPGSPCAHIPWVTIAVPPAFTVALNDVKIQTSRPGSEGAAGGGGMGTGAGATPCEAPAAPRAACTSTSTPLAFTWPPASA